MTSGIFHSVPTDSITVDREGRQRRELGDIPVLADSISRLGLIHPIVLTRDLTLVAGERRLEACRALGHTHISVQYLDELSPHHLRSIELEENVKRQALPWQDECKAIYEYYQLRRVDDPTFSQEELGAALGITQPLVSKKMTVARELLAGNDRITQAPRLSTAIGITERTSARKDQEALGELRKVSNIAAPIEAPDAIIVSNFNEWAPTYEGPKFNFIHCDFPYGIEANTFPQGAAALHGGYADTESTYWTLCKSLVTNLPRLTTESCHFLFWFSMHHYQSTLQFFEQNSDISFDPFPLVWVKSDNVGILPDPQRGPRRIYETALFGSRGDRKVVGAVSNAYSAPTDRGFHMSVKPEPVLRNFFRMFVDESTLMLDPTCGSGSSLRAAESLSARFTLGLEINPEFAEQANRTLNSFRNLRRTK